MVPDHLPYNHFFGGVKQKGVFVSPDLQGHRLTEELKFLYQSLRLVTVDTRFLREALAQ